MKQWIIKHKIMISTISSILLVFLFSFIFIGFSDKNSSFGQTYANLFSKQMFQEGTSANRSLWILLATIFGGIGLVLAGISSQSLTKNSLADASTLGVINSVVFFIIVSLSFGIINVFFQLTFALIGSVVAAGILILIVQFNKSAMTKTKLILAGLAISIAFKTLAFFFWRTDRGIGAAYAAYTLGGAENIYGQTYLVYPWIILLISVLLIIASIVLMIVNSQGMNVTEMGDDKAKGLGISAKKVKAINVLIMLLTIPTSILLVGNVAFIGLIAIHGSRIIFKTTNYKKTIPYAILIGVLVSTFGLFMYILIPQFTSSIWTTVVGAPLLIFLAWKGL